jgi:tRNA(Ile)-lysidine synthase
MNKSESISIKNSVRESIRKHFAETPFFVIGVSGGPDSMALLYLLHKLDTEALVVHVNYGMRGEDSDLDQELVEGFSSEWGFECCSIKAESQDREENNFQSWARNFRYQAFRDLAEEFGADAIITAHHQDDQVETILQKVLRGSGPESWQGMSVREEDLFRPLLGFSKEMIVDFCELNNVPFRIDESNLSSGYARNFLRNELSDSLNDFFPGWKQNVLKLNEFGKLNQLAVDHIINEIGAENSLNIEKLSGLEPVLKLALIKRFIERSGKDIAITRGLLSKFEKLDKLQTGAVLSLNEDWSFVVDREDLVLKSEFEEKPSAFIITMDEAEQGVLFSDIVVHQRTKPAEEPGIYFDAGSVAWPVTLRAWSNGDSFQPLGMKGTQKVSDHLTNRKIASSEKEKALILSGSDGTIYAIIYPTKADNGELGCISEKVKAGEHTRQFITITKSNL